MIVMEETWFDDPPFSELYKVLPAKVRHPDPDFVIGTYVRTNSECGNFLFKIGIGSRSYDQNFDFSFSFIPLSIVCDTSHVHCDSINTYHI